MLNEIGQPAARAMERPPTEPAPPASGRALARTALAAAAAAGIAGGLAAWFSGDSAAAALLSALAASAVAGAAAAVALRGPVAEARALAVERDATRAALEAARASLDGARRAAEADRLNLLEAERQARADAERSDRAKDEFIATVSHELRTPLNAVLGWARLLRMGKLDPAATSRAVETIERSASAQAQIVDDLLDVSRIVQGQLRLDVRAVELVPVIEAAIDAVRHSAAARQIEIAAVLMPRAGPVSGDPGRLQQVVWNLLSNAIKFTPHGGRVEVRLDQDDDHVAIRVRDTGPGIDPAFLPHLFERFRQADSSSTRAYGGLGLGLAIVRHLVEAHGGSVSAASEGPGLGSAFTVLLPLSTRPRRAREAARPGRSNGEVQPLASLSRLRVLVVDDDPDTLEVVRQVLEQAGALVTAATSAREALEALSVRPPDVLLSDIGMPGEDGFALIRRVRNLDSAHGGQVPAAALTGYTQAEDRRQALSAGYQVYLSKPIEPSELTATVARLAGRAGSA